MKFRLDKSIKLRNGYIVGKIYKGKGECSLQQFKILPADMQFNQTIGTSCEVVYKKDNFGWWLEGDYLLVSTNHLSREIVK